MNIICIKKDMNIDLTLSSLQDKGYRITKIRKEMVKIFSESAIPLSANTIERMISKSGLSVNKTTIYRELHFFLENGHIVETYLHHNEVSYESSGLQHHHHLVCEVCGRIDNVTNCLTSKLEADVYKKKGFRIERHVLEFYGTCASCARNR